MHMRHVHVFANGYLYITGNLQLCVFDSSYSRNKNVLSIAANPFYHVFWTPWKLDTCTVYILIFYFNRFQDITYWGMPQQVIPRVNSIYSNILVDGLPNTPYVQEKHNMIDLNLTSQWQQNARLGDGYMRNFTES